MVCIQLFLLSQWCVWIKVTGQERVELGAEKLQNSPVYAMLKAHFEMSDNKYKMWCDLWTHTIWVPDHIRVLRTWHVNGVNKGQRAGGWREAQNQSEHLRGFVQWTMVSKQRTLIPFRYWKKALWLKNRRQDKNNTHRAKGLGYQISQGLAKQGKMLSPRSVEILSRV